MLEDGSPTRASLKAQRNLLFNLEPGDQVLVCSLETLKMSTGELVQLLRKFDQTGVVLRIVTRKAVSTVSFSGRTRSLLALLATNEQLRPGRADSAPRRRPRSKSLNRYQLDYAIELHRHGASLRMIGLLFQTSPSELLKLMNQRGFEARESKPGVESARQPHPKARAATTAASPNRVILPHAPERPRRVRRDPP
ncbi:MAG TPA: hypothetical protein VGN89_13675 [Phenylobacterium sp.]|nr:hypothetical protein [Phenylobacterium sp.]